MNARKKRFMLLFSMIFAVAMASCSRSLEDGGKDGVLTLLALATPSPGASQTYWYRWFPVDNTADKIMVHENRLYMAGNFNQVAANTRGGAIVNLTDGTLSAKKRMPLINGLIAASAPDGQGGWYIGGTFTKINGATRNRIARINGDGSLHDWNPDANNEVSALAVSGTTVYAGGSFTAI
ncbi:MAG TPA: delta-60 repeat domain-containing protein, partial [Spirochaetota bacterium]|nr:delta-60 repeat domain-containing protein [Spirochaetota bacterium]